MRLRTVGAVSALALFAGLGPAALAQAPGPGQERERAPGQQMAPGQQERTPGQRAAPGRQQTAPGQQMAPGQRGQAQQQGERRQRRQAEQPDRRQPQRGAEQPDRERQRAQEPTRRDRQQTQEPTRRDRQQAQEPQRRDRQRAQQPEQRDRQRAEQPDRRQQAERPDRPQVSDRQRASVRERFRESGGLDRARVADVDFNISVGTSVPRRISLAPLPTVIVEEIPAYRGYRYFMVRDEIVIVEPSTYVIVDVIQVEGAPARAAQADGRLTLTGEQRRVVLSHIDLQPEIRLGIGGVSIGMSIPQTIELHPFPSAVIEDVPELEGYRYFVFEQEVAVVDPEERQVVLTIGE